MTGVFYRSGFEVTKPSQVMRRHVSYTSNGETTRQSKKHCTGWQKVLERLLNVTLMLAMCNLPFRGSTEEVSNANKGNFLSIIQLIAKYDSVLDKLLQLPKGSPKYLISLLAGLVLQDIKIELQSAPFFAIILDTTQDVSKKDLLREVFRYVKILTMMMERHVNCKLLKHLPKSKIHLRSDCTN